MHTERGTQQFPDFGGTSTPRRWRQCMDILTDGLKLAPYVALGIFVAGCRVAASCITRTRSSGPTPSTEPSEWSTTGRTLTLVNGGTSARTGESLPKISFKAPREICWEKPCSACGAT